MTYFFWVSGILLAVIWLDRVRDATAMRHLPDLSHDEWNRLVPPGVTLSVIVPARNEERHIEATLRSLLAQDFPAEIIVVDDRSTDATGAILDRVEREVSDPSRLRVLHVTELPPRWLGKTHAMWLAARQAKGDWLLFTDADTDFRPDLLRRALIYARASGADHLSLTPRIDVATVGGRMILTFFQIMFVFGHRPWKVADPKSHDSFGMGAFNLVRRQVYEEVGTWEALRLAIVEDMKMGEMVKQRGFAQRVAVGMDLLTNHWARNGRDVVRNLTKNFYAVMRYKWWLASAAVVGLFGFNLLPFAGIWLAHGWARVPFALALGAIAAFYIGMGRSQRFSPLYFFLHPIATFVFAYTVVRSMVHAFHHGGVVWRGTKYPIEELRQTSGIDVLGSER